MWIEPSGISLKPLMESPMVSVFLNFSGRSLTLTSCL